MPAGTPLVLSDAWMGCIEWACGHGLIRKHYQQATGIATCDMPHPVDVTDAASSFHKPARPTEATKFVDWVNENVWGTENLEDQ